MTSTTYKTLSEIPNLVEYLASLPSKELTNILRDERMMNDFKYSLYPNYATTSQHPSLSGGCHSGQMVFEDIMQEVRERRLAKKIEAAEKMKGKSMGEEEKGRMIVEGMVATSTKG
ncbi:hypothetical protein I302_107144 [Kwoniella bestiolae CBS 10118]|uniref:Uncharacterized protein n=1 Tax=Kwoniella bestiolae CBS 10118 TaxID=1296100 RepID=A0A1B9FZD7_9TREE|nr:hypothetical protein I302_05590 [Kwoniella bestiolae CBS 10118]OCF24132.1 hypothetical protein I302_05590 [Kwoniella bestiolae CBS 10118]